MATAARVELRPNNEAPRRPCQVERGTTNYISNSSSVDSLIDHRAQRLVMAAGLSFQRAVLVAGLAWGEAG